MRSREWFQKDQNPDLLLRGSQIDATIGWITAGADKEPHLNQVQREYVAASSKAERDQQAAEIQRQQQELHRQRIWLGMVGTAFVIASGLGGLAFNQYRIAEHRRKEVEYSQIEILATSVEAFLNANQGLDGLLYGLKAARKLDQMENIPIKTEFRVIAALQQALHNTPDRNRLVGHSDEIWHAVLSPDGRYIASGSVDNTAKLWTLDGKEIATFGKHKEPVSWASISSNNKLIATASEDKIIKIWNQKGELLRILKGHEQGVRSVNFTPDGQQLVSASRDGTIKFWGLDGQALKTIKAHPQTCNASFSPNGKLLITFSCGDEIKLWNRNGELIKAFSIDTGVITRVAFTPDSKTIAASTWDGEIALWTVDGQKIRTIQEAHSL